MKWLVIALTVFALTDFNGILVDSQCFTENDRFNVAIQTDLKQITDFGLDLLNQFLPLANGGNVFFSPYSIWSALTLAYFGSGGKTETQLQSVLRMDDKIAALRIWKALDLTYQLRNLVGKPYTFNLANRIYVDVQLPFRECAVSILREEVQHVDFREKVKAVNLINAFVSNKTGGKIRDLLDADALSDALLVLVNAAYFKGVWDQKFNADLTRPEPFTSLDLVQEDVQMMNLNGRFNYGVDENLGARLVELPYEGNVVSMYVLLPSSEGEAAFNNVIASLNGALLQRLITNMTMSTVNLKLPRFAMETTLEDELSVSLQNLGIIDLFNKTAGNLTRFVEGTNMGISKSIHKAFVNVTEKGTEAAAATAFVINTRISIPRPRNAIDFTCNRPFIFFLGDKDTNNILFVGAYRKAIKDTGKKNMGGPGNAV